MKANEHHLQASGPALKSNRQKLACN
uniref:Uncharacterized protein n=1 Tax=Anguilla anguilla TaxID=7936 RepID=A0A0E9Q948_ANGAN